MIRGLRTVPLSDVQPFADETVELLVVARRALARAGRAGHPQVGNQALRPLLFELLLLGPPSPQLTSVLPDESMPRSTAVVVAGSASFLVQLVGATQADGWVALVGWPELSVLALAEAGVDLEHSMLIPETRGRDAEIVAALLDGSDQVVVGPHVALTASDRRQLLARARRQNNTLLTGRAWEQAALRLRVDRATWSGARHGDYWLREVRYDVTRQARGDSHERRFMVSRDADTVRVEAIHSGARLVSVGA